VGCRPNPSLHDPALTTRYGGWHVGAMLSPDASRAAHLHSGPPLNSRAEAPPSVAPGASTLRGQYFAATLLPARSPASDAQTGVPSAAVADNHGVLAGALPTEVI
jgi:hypothetical protein